MGKAEWGYFGKEKHWKIKSLHPLNNKRFFNSYLNTSPLSSTSLYIKAQEGKIRKYIFVIIEECTSGNFLVTSKTRYILSLYFCKKKISWKPSLHYSNKSDPITRRWVFFMAIKKKQQEFFFKFRTLEK